jgi:hypothetical protein
VKTLSFGERGGGIAALIKGNVPLNHISHKSDVICWNQIISTQNNATICEQLIHVFFVLFGIWTNFLF